MEADTGYEETKDHKSTIVVTSDTGVILGNVNRAFFDPNSKKITALSYRRKFLGKEFFLDINEIESVGKDVVFVSSHAESHAWSKTDQAPGEDLRNFQGVWVYTQSGQPVAAITDLEFDRQTWVLDTLYFCDDRALRVTPSDADVAHEKVIISDSMANSISNLGVSHGLLASLFGSEGVEEASIVLQRALRGITTRSFHNGWDHGSKRV